MCGFRFAAQLDDYHHPDAALSFSANARTVYRNSDAALWVKGAGERAKDSSTGSSLATVDDFQSCKICKSTIKRWCRTMSQRFGCVRCPPVNKLHQQHAGERTDLCVSSDREKFETTWGKSTSSRLSSLVCRVCPVSRNVIQVFFSVSIS